LCADFPAAIFIKCTENQVWGKVLDRIYNLSDCDHRIMHIE